jgi:hypothetical protein
VLRRIVIPIGLPSFRSGSALVRLVAQPLLRDDRATKLKFGLAGAGFSEAYAGPITFTKAQKSLRFPGDWSLLEANCAAPWSRVLRTMRPASSRG